MPPSGRSQGFSTFLAHRIQLHNRARGAERLRLGTEPRRQVGGETAREKHVGGSTRADTHGVSGRVPGSGDDHSSETVRRDEEDIQRRLGPGNRAGSGPSHPHGKVRHGQRHRTDRRRPGSETGCVVPCHRGPAQTRAKSTTNNPHCPEMSFTDRENTSNTSPRHFSRRRRLSGRSYRRHAG